MRQPGTSFGDGLASEGKAGRFAHFEDPDGNVLYLAQLNWGHVSEGEGKYRGVCDLILISMQPFLHVRPEFLEHVGESIRAARDQ